MNDLKCPIILFLFLIVSCSSSAFEDAQDFTPNKAPEVNNVNVTLPDGSANPGENIIPNMQFKISADVTDPENKELDYEFASNQGSFAEQESTATGVSVIFVTSNLTALEPVTVTLTAKDPTRKNNTTVETIEIGMAKPFPKISISPTSLTITPTTSATLTLTADCTGSFQLIHNDTATSASELHIDNDKNVFGIETLTGINKDVTATVYGHSPLPGTSMNHAICVNALGPHKIWVVFKDLMGQETAVLCTVTENSL